MDFYKLLTDKLILLNSGSIVTNLICEPTTNQLQSLLKGSGNPEAEMRQVNSSAGLAVNFWRAYELCKPEAIVEFEWKKIVPLRWGRPANIDVVVRSNNVEDFYESKFLEPYYSNNEIPRESYFDESKYSSYTKDSAHSWVELFKRSSEFQYYNVTQLIRHLLAISKHMWKNPKYYCDKQINLVSVVWDMPDSFAAMYEGEIENALIQRRTVIRKEAEQCEKLLNDFIQEHLPMKNLFFKAIKYNNIIEQISDDELRSKLESQYFL